MDSNKAWDDFTKTGSIKSYLLYRMYSRLNQDSVRGQIDETVDKRTNSQRE